MSTALPIGSSEYERIFKESGLIPDVIKKAPRNIVSVDYDSGATACLGNLLASVQTRTEPRFNWTSTPKTLYTVVMVDPDAPMAFVPVLGEMLHYLSVNVPSADRFYEGDVIRPYTPPGPPLTSGHHRYLFLVYEQSERITVGFTLPFRFYIQEFAERYKLGDKLYHQPAFGNYMKVVNSLTRRSTSCELMTNKN